MSRLLPSRAGSRLAAFGALALVVVGVVVAFRVGGRDAATAPVSDVSRDAPDGSSAGAANDPEAASASSEATATTEPPAVPFSLVWVGDMMIGSTTPSPELPPDDGAGAFGAVVELLQADLVTGNLEGPLTDDGPTGKCGSGSSDCYMFSQPPSYANVYKAAGFEVLNLANNHARDRGDTGQEQTKAHLDGVGILHTGFGPEHVAKTEVNGNRIAAIGFYRVTNPLDDLAAVGEQVRAADTDADVVVVFFHGGAEGEQGLHTEQSFIDFAHAAIDAGADIVLGSGPHVLRGIEFYNGRLIAYSLGNFATYGKFSLSGNKAVSAVLSVTLASDGSFVSGNLAPVRLVGQGLPEPGGTGVELIQRLSAEDFGATAAAIDADGNISAPVP